MKSLLFSLLLISANLSFGQIVSDTIPSGVRPTSEIKFVSEQASQSLNTVDSLIQDDRSQDSLTVSDTLKAKKTFFLKRWLVDDYPNPKKGMLIGLVVPGGGQIYNGSMWKVPLVYGAYGTIIYLISENSRQYKVYRDAVIARLDENLKDDFTNLDVSNLRTIRDEFQKSKEFAYFGLIGIAILSVAEAFVDGHLKDFDVSDDLSFKIKPSFVPTIASITPAIGIGFRFSFH